MGFASTFEDLEVYKKAYALSLVIHKATLSFPKEEMFALSQQMRKASKSICACIAEGFVKQGQSSLEFARFLSMSIGSAGEMQVWIQYTIDLNYVPLQQGFAWKEEYLLIVKMLQKLRNSVAETI